MKLFKSLSDEHGLILCMRPTAFTLTHALFSLSMCVFSNNWWKPVANIISISLITFTKLITQVHSLNLSISGATLYALLLLSLSFLKVVIEFYCILLSTHLIIINLYTNSSRTAEALLTKLFNLFHYNKTLFSINILTPFAQHFLPIQRSNGLAPLIIKSLAILCTCKYDQHKWFVYKCGIYVPSFYKKTYLFTYPRTIHATSHLWAKLNVMIEQLNYTLYLLSYVLSLFIYTPIIPVDYHITHWINYTFYHLFCTQHFVNLVGGRETWVGLEGVNYVNSFYPP